MLRFPKWAIFPIAAGGVLLPFTAAAAPTANPPATIAGVSDSSGTVTWTITVSGNDGTAEFALLYPAQPAGSVVSGLPLFITGNGSATFTQSGAKCGGTVAVDLLEGAVTYSDLEGRATVDCPPPTTTTVPMVTQQSVPTTTTVPSGFAGDSGGGQNCGAGPNGACPTTTTTAPPAGTTRGPSIAQEQQQIQIAPGVTAGNG